MGPHDPRVVSKAYTDSEADCGPCHPRVDNPLRPTRSLLTPVGPIIPAWSPRPTRSLGAPCGPRHPGVDSTGLQRVWHPLCPCHPGIVSPLSLRPTRSLAHPLWSPIDPGWSPRPIRSLAHPCVVSKAYKDSGHPLWSLPTGVVHHCP